LDDEFIGLTEGISRVAQSGIQTATEARLHLWWIVSSVARGKLGARLVQ
jgi:hypothetical protein